MPFFSSHPSFLHVSTAEYCFHPGHSCDYSHLPRPFFVLSQVLCGSAHYRGKSGEVTVNAGELLFVPQGETYVSHWEGEGVLGSRSVFFSFQGGTDAVFGCDFLLQKLANPSPELLALFDRVVGAKQADFEMMGALYQLCALLFPQLESRPGVRNLSAIRPALDYIEAHVDQMPSVAFLASLCHLSESRFYHLFRQLTGFSPVVYRNNVAVNHAIALLRAEPGRTVEQISAECGFSSAIYFRRILKKNTGKTPRQFREMGDL